MPLLPPLAPLFAAMNAPANEKDNRSVSERRAAMDAMIDGSFSAFADQPDPLPLERDYQVPVDGGDIKVRVFSPHKVGPALPVHMNFHGGGFWLGTLDQTNAACRKLAAAVDCIVVSVDYRLAPEHKFPVAAEDCYAALLWVADHATELNADASRITVGGGSAGGNLAAVVSLMARDRKGPKIALQLLEIPVTDCTRLEPLHKPADGLIIASGKDVYCGYYLRDAADGLNPYASPLLADDLTGLPPALIMCAEYDPLQPEGAAYAEKLEAAGVPVEYHCWAGQFHGSQAMSRLIHDEAADYHAKVVRALKAFQ
jgi:acetyl esterase